MNFNIRYSGEGSDSCSNSVTVEGLVVAVPTAFLPQQRNRQVEINPREYNVANEAVYR